MPSHVSRKIGGKSIYYVGLGALVEYVPAASTYWL